ncbi:TadE/TadG family type IV pilus assembly protein [Methylopila sp. 73B]|uniref:TadE/TadG family type IV pilus assembly protein n=1 Tax=Methylopila sp. 73B TaxID=1120792 RepID=UPI00056437B0|nr:TadE/TadG family type IV pilus assembly protein [Methylopila sp. 73B]
MSNPPRLSFLTRFRRSEDGAAMPLIGLSAFAMLGAMGLSLDAGRGVVARARLVNALDAAGLAVGARVSTSDYDGDALKFVQSNFAAGYDNATVTSVKTTVSSDKSLVTLTATASLPTTFMQLFGTKTMNVTAYTEITRAVTGIELALVLDNTGSMSGSIASLKSAANDLVDSIFAGKSTTNNIYVGLVPFSQTVNIGTSNTSWLKTGAVAALDWGTTSWGGCVEERSNGYDQTDDAPKTAATRFAPYYSPDDDADPHLNNWITTSSNWKNGQWVTTKSYTINSSKGPNINCPSEITPMTPVKTTIKSGISKMTAVGATHINMGAVWGWRMLSPSWRGTWAGDMATYSLPLDYGTKRMTKAAVIMTDGDNTLYDGLYTAYGYPSEGRLGVTSASAGEPKLDARLTAVCGKMKAAGITVFTVAFNNPASATKTLMQNCATSTSYYFDAGNSTSLANAFKTIGDTLSNLRVSK